MSAHQVRSAAGPVFTALHALRPTEWFWPRGAEKEQPERRRKAEERGKRTVVQAWTKNLPTGVRLYMV